MGCGCGRNKNANIPSRFNPAQQINQLPQTTNITSPPSTGVATNPTAVNSPRTMINSDRVRIERLRREAIARSKGI